MYVPDRPLDPPEGDELPEDEFRCHRCGERRMNEDLGYTRILCKRPQMTVEVCTCCATKAGLHQCKDCLVWGDEETVFGIVKEPGERLREACDGDVLDAMQGIFRRSV